jgi:predicted CoA-binding protein
MTGTSEREPWHPPSARERLQILEATRSIAIVGASSNPARASHFVATYLLSSSTDYEVWFVNPREHEILGRPVYASLADLPETPDLVDVFRRSTELPSVAAEAVAVGACTFWAQLGLFNEEAVAIAWQGGLSVVMNRCVKIEHARFAGGLHLAGFDTGVISARRPVPRGRR